MGGTVRRWKQLGKDVEPDLKRAIEAFNQIFGAQAA